MALSLIGNSTKSKCQLYLNNIVQFGLFCMTSFICPFHKFHIKNEPGTCCEPAASSVARMRSSLSIMTSVDRLSVSPTSPPVSCLCLSQRRRLAHTGQERSYAEAPRETRLRERRPGQEPPTGIPQHSQCRQGLASCSLDCFCLPFHRLTLIETNDNYTFILLNTSRVLNLFCKDTLQMYSLLNLTNWTVKLL